MFFCEGLEVFGLGGVGFLGLCIFLLLWCWFLVIDVFFLFGVELWVSGMSCVVGILLQQGGVEIGWRYFVVLCGFFFDDDQDC